MSNYIRAKGEKCKIHKHTNETDFNIMDMKMGDIICMNQTDREIMNYKIIYRTDTEFLIKAREDFEFLIIDSCISEHIEDPRDFYSTKDMKNLDLTVYLCEKHQKIYCMDYLYHDYDNSFYTFEELEDYERMNLEFEYERDLKNISNEMKNISKETKKFRQ